MENTNGPPSLLHLSQPDLQADPYPLYHQLRAIDPVHWDGGSWVLTRHADVVAVLHDARCTAVRPFWDPAHFPEGAREGVSALNGLFSRWMVFVDPPDHTRLRGLVHRAFTPRVVEGLRPRIQEIVDGVLDRALAAGRMDVIRDLAYPLPVTVIAEMLGVPPEDRDRCKRWSDHLAQFLGSFDFAWDRLAEITRSVREMTEYLGGVVAERRRAPQNDLISGLLAAEEQGDALTAEELLTNCLLLLFAGHETTTNLIGNGTLALLRHPDQLERLRTDPALVPAAVEELLRYDSPVQMTSRVAGAEMELGGRRIAPGQLFTLVLGAANRDPAQFRDPDRLDLGRRENRHVAFGHGIHFCLGAALARLEGQLALGTLLRRLPGLRLATDRLEWRPNQALRGLRSLPARWD